MKSDFEILRLYSLNRSCDKETVCSNWKSKFMNYKCFTEKNRCPPPQQNIPRNRYYPA